MLQNGTTELSKTEKKERAAHLVAEDRLSDELIAKEVGVARQTLVRWKAEPTFAARVERIVAETAEALKAEGLRSKQNRLDALNDRHRRMCEVIEARAKEHAGYPGGGSTGLLVREIKVLGKGEDAREVAEYSVDTPLLKEMRETEKQAAIEVGEWTENVKHSGTVETVLILPKSDAGG